MEMIAILKTQNNEQIQATVIEKDLPKGVKAVFIQGKSKEALDSEHGADILFTLSDIEGMTALQRCTEFWCEPVFTKEYSYIPDETQMLVAKHTDGSFTFVLPVVSEKYRCVLYGDEKGIHAKLFTWCDGIEECNCLAFTYTRTNDPAKASEACFTEALKELDRPILPRKDRIYPEMFEYLGWCSWDALQIRVSEEGLLEKCREFREKDIPVRWAIIDDMWATIPRFNTQTYSSRKEMFKLMHTSPIADFEAEPKRFPRGLCHAISEMKNYLTWVGVWHPTTGYWFGIDPQSQLYSRFQNNLMATHDGRHIVKPTYEDYIVFLNAFHAFLKDCGADFVKVDNQSLIRRFYKKQGTVGQMATAIHTAIDSSAKKYFNLGLINCMGCASENIWSRPESPISRCSDDFQPEDREWFTHHILQCAYTCLLQGPVTHSDWDMWWTDDGQAVKNSVIRAISGGPIYVSDEIGRSERDILMPLVLRDGRILRCQHPATPTLDCFAEDPRDCGKNFKIQNLAGTGGALAVFNLDPREQKTVGTISPSDIPDLAGECFAVYEHLTGEVFTMDRDARKTLNLKDRDDFRLYTFSPIVDGFAVIGLKNKFMSPLTVKQVTGRSYELYEEGTCIVYRDGAFFEE